MASALLLTEALLGNFLICDGIVTFSFHYADSLVKRAFALDKSGCVGVAKERDDDNFKTKILSARRVGGRRICRAFPFVGGVGKEEDDAL